MHLPAALEEWAAQHSEQLSAETLYEVRTIAKMLAQSSLGERRVDALGDDIGDEVRELFPASRAERAATLVQVVSTWAAASPTVGAPPPTNEIVTTDTAAAAVVGEPVSEALADDQRDVGDAATDSEPLVAIQQPTGVVDPVFEPTPSLPSADLPGAVFEEPIESPAFLRSDKVDEEDDVRLYGPKRPWKAILGTLFSLALLAAIGAAAWYWFTQREEPAETTAAAVEDTTPVPQDDSIDTEDAAPTAVATAAPTPVPEPTPLLPSYWADTTPILNSGSAEIAASTYAVSPANRAVLTGHTSAITGIVITNDGRVLTSGADRRLVDWGADVTLANPDVLNVPSPLTVLERTADQRLIAGDAAGNITIIDLVETAEPVVLGVHLAAISASTELSDGRIAVASVDGDVDVFAIDTPNFEEVTLAHDGEVTGVVGLDDGTIVTAAVDGIIRLWPADGSDAAEVDTLGAPATALTVLDDGQLAAASVQGDIHVFPAEPDASPTLVIPGHVGAVRSLYEVQLDDSPVLASGGDDTTIRLWSLSDGAELLVLEGHGDIISGLDSLPDGRLVSTSGDGTGRVWDLSVEPGAPVIAPHDWNLSALHPWDNDQFVTGGVDGKVTLSSTSETTEPTLITEHDTPVVGVATLQNGDIVSLDASSILRINQADGTLSDLVEITLSPGATALDVRDSLGVVTGHADGSVRFHDFAEEVAVIEAHGSGVNDVLAHSTGVVVSAGQDMTVRILDFEDPETLPVFDLHTSPVDVVIELDDGRIASAGSDGIFVWSLEDLGQDHIRLNGQRSRTISLVALPNDRLISTGDDGRVRLWDLSTPEAEPTTLVDIPGVVNPHLIQAGNGLYVAGAARGYVVFTLS